MAPCVSSSPGCSCCWPPRPSSAARRPESRSTRQRCAEGGVGDRREHRDRPQDHRTPRLPRIFRLCGARKQADLDALNAIKNVQAVRLDVTQQKDIDAAVETISKGGRGLYGLVNNAGIATMGPVAETSMEEFDLLMDVNVYGPYRMAKAFTPLIVSAKGRITNIGSISGILASRDLAAYSMSKHAIEAFTDSLAAQLAPLGVQVNVVEPGNYDTDIGKNAAQRAGVDSRFADRSKYKKPDEVAAAVEALFEENPKRRYMVVPEQHEAEITIRKQVEQRSSTKASLIRMIATRW